MHKDSATLHELWVEENILKKFKFYGVKKIFEQLETAIKSYYEESVGENGELRKYYNTRSPAQPGNLKN